MVWDHERERALLTFDHAVDDLGEQAGFLAATRHARAARYVLQAHDALAEVRLTMHELEARAASPSLRRRARVKLHRLAIGVAEAGIFDAARVTQIARKLGESPSPKQGIAPAIANRAARASVWSREKVTGSTIQLGSLQSTRASADAMAQATLIVRRGTIPPPLVGRRGRIAAWTAGTVGALGVLSLAVYGAIALFT
ncbi:MAG: hypothetical protein QM607_08785 [Microbacterium sp.]